MAREAELETTHRRVIHALKRMSRCREEVSTYLRLRHPISGSTFRAEGILISQRGKGMEDFVPGVGRGVPVNDREHPNCPLRPRHGYMKRSPCSGRMESSYFFGLEAGKLNGLWPTAKALELGFRASKEDQIREGQTVAR